MQAPINQEALQEKWAPLLDADGQSKISDPHRRMVTAVLLGTKSKHFVKKKNSYTNNQQTAQLQVEQ